MVTESLWRCSLYFFPLGKDGTSSTDITATIHDWLVSFKNEGLPCQLDRPAPRCAELTHWSSFSGWLKAPRCPTEHHRKTFLPVAIKLSLTLFILALCTVLFGVSTCIYSSFQSVHTVYLPLVILYLFFIFFFAWLFLVDTWKGAVVTAKNYFPSELIKEFPFWLMPGPFFSSCGSVGRMSQTVCCHSLSLAMCCLFWHVTLSLPARPAQGCAALSLLAKSCNRNLQCKILAAKLDSDRPHWIPLASVVTSFSVRRWIIDCIVY